MVSGSPKNKTDFSEIRLGRISRKTDATTPMAAAVEGDAKGRSGAPASQAGADDHELGGRGSRRPAEARVSNISKRGASAARSSSNRSAR